MHHNKTERAASLVMNVFGSLQSWKRRKRGILVNNLVDTLYARVSIEVKFKKIVTDASSAAGK